MGYSNYIDEIIGFWIGYVVMWLRGTYTNIRRVKVILGSLLLPKRPKDDHVLRTKD